MRDRPPRIGREYTKESSILPQSRAVSEISVVNEAEPSRAPVQPSTPAQSPYQLANLSAPMPCFGWMPVGCVAEPSYVNSATIAAHALPVGPAVEEHPRARAAVLLDRKRN